MPRTIQDAIRISRQLGILYLWVDALCIIQDSTEDWDAESGKMAAVYGNAYLTILAALSPDVQFGIPRRRPLRRPKTVFAWKTHRGPQDTSAAEPIHDRGWTLQERLLSRRSLIFGSDQLYWECRHFQRNERYTDLRHPQYSCSLGSYKPSDWRYIATEYSNRSLTFELDRLPALSGIARAFHLVTRKEYFAGMWAPDVPIDLLWYPEKKRRPMDTDSEISVYLAPSWSWLSYRGKIAMRIYRDREGIPPGVLQCSSVVACHLELASGNQFGQLKGGYIELFGPLLRFEEMYWPSLPFPDIHFDDGSLFSELNFDLERLQEHRYLPILIDRDYYYGMSGLILARVNTVEWGHGVFQRVGMFTACWPTIEIFEKRRWDKWLQGCGKGTIRII